MFRIRDGHDEDAEGYRNTACKDVMGKIVAAHPDEHGDDVPSDHRFRCCRDRMGKRKKDERSGPYPCHNNGIDVPDEKEGDAQKKSSQNALANEWQRVFKEFVINDPDDVFFHVKPIPLIMEGRVDGILLNSFD